VCEPALVGKELLIRSLAEEFSARPPRKILIVKPSALGDIVHTLPVLRLLRRRFPRAQIFWLVAGAFAGLIEHHPDLDGLIRFDRGGDSPAMAFMSLLRELGEMSFDLTIDLQGLARSAMITYATGAPVRVGFSYARELAPLAYTHRVGSRGVDRHAIDRYLDVCEELGCGRGPVEFPFVINPSQVQQQIPTRDPLAVLLPGTNWATKKWPIGHYAKLCELIGRELSMRVAIAGAKDVIELADRVPGAINLANRTSLPQLVALLERADVVVANDSGPMHIAAALGRPLVTIFGPTNPVRTGPYQRMDTVVRLDIACSPCYSRKCSHTSCMNWLTPEQVLAQVRAALPVRTII
jgi:heptosyltransferase I